MKRKFYICLVIITLFSITGCGSNTAKKENSNVRVTKETYEKITCINNNDIISDNTTVVLEYKNNYVKKATYTYNIKSEAKTLASAIYKEFNNDFKDISGVESSFDNDVIMQIFDFEKIDLSLYQIAKTNYINFISSSAEKDFSYISENKVLLDAYKNTELSNFTCK